MSSLPENMEAGPQPIEQLLEKHNSSVTDIIKASDEHLTHKVIRKACRGRRLTKRMQNKIVRALNHYANTEYRRDELFNYDGH